MLLSEIQDDFLVAKEVEEGCSANTIKAYHYDLQIMIQVLGDLDCEKITKFHIRKILKILHQRNYTKRALARKIACYKSFFHFCIENEILEKNPMQAIKSPKINAQETLPKFLNYQEMELLLEKVHTIQNFSCAWRERLELVIRLMYASMARVSEICNLKLQDVDLQKKLIKVRGKGNKERFIPIDEQTSNLLHHHIENRQFECGSTNAPLFVNMRGNCLQPRSIQRDIHDLKRYLEFAEDKKLTPHVFRHTGATHLRQNGMDISELQDLLGHANPNTTRIYAKNDMTRLQVSYDHYHPLANKENQNPKI